ncbi:MAG TPA: protein-glutamine glutaminase family protein [Chitinophagaceae bacterium]
MPKYKVYLGKIRSSSPLMGMIAQRRADERAKPLEVKFEGEWKGKLQLDNQLGNAWAKMLDHLQQNNRPVYLEIDHDTNNITRLLVPFATKVIDVALGENVANVGFTNSHANHFLRRNHPDFDKFFNALQNAKTGDTEVLVTSTHPEFEIIDVREVPPSYGLNSPMEPPPPLPPDPPVSPQRATDLFNMMKADTCTPCSSTSPCIPFKYPYDGCWIRAHLMCYKMVAEGETPEKIWIHYGGLVAATVNVPECQVAWGWHVAPTLMVTQSSGPDIKMVIDPSLCDGPVTPEAWRDLQRPTANLTPSAWTAYGYLATGTATQAQADSAMEEYRIKLDVMCANFGPSPYACPIVRRAYFIVDRSTISKDEVDAMLTSSNPSSIDAAFYFVVEGFIPTELGITNATLSGIPNIQPVFQFNPATAGITMDVIATIKLEYPTHLNRRQRITWKYKINFTSSAGFVNELDELNLAASMTSTSGTIATVSGTGKIYLIKQPNPYEIDGAVSWLSTDLRVFQIKAGESKFNKTITNDPSNFITGVIQNLNNGNTGGQSFENNISTDQQTSKLELSQSVGGTSVYNFAVAKVRYRALSLSATNVRVFFRLFPASSTSLEFNQSSTYRRNPDNGVIKPVLGIINGETVTIPCFASPRINSAAVSLSTQTDPQNVQTIPPNAGGNEVTRYFGCWLDINQTTPQFPFNPSPADGPWSSGRQSIQEHVRNEHQCLVAEIAFDPTPIPSNAFPSTSDKLAQRNLAIVQSANPGEFASHRIPHTFEIKPTHINRSGEEGMPDELMIDWGNTPTGCLATLYISGINTNDIIALANTYYRTHGLVRVDANTIQCETGGMSYIPIPASSGSNFPAMLSIDLPAGVKAGQAFTVVVHQITNEARREVFTHIPEGESLLFQRRVHGSFQITIPVVHKESMLVHEEILLSNLRWILRAIPAANRWYSVFTRYVRQVADRVDALGGNADKVVASPSDDWKARYNRCRSLSFFVILLIAVLIILSGALSGSSLPIAVIIALALLIFVLNYWMKQCKPGICSILKAILFGAGTGTVVLAILLLIGATSSQLVAVLTGSAIVTLITGILCWIRGCFK